jgi:hypothetical protein
MILDHASQILHDSIPSMFLAAKGELKKQEIRIVNREEAHRGPKRFDNEYGPIW